MIKYTGAIIDKKDKRDYKYSEIIAGSGASDFDWDVGYDVEEEIGEKLKTKNQGESLSCGGQAMGYYGAVLNRVFDGTLEERSAKFIYSQVFSPYGGGSGMRELNKLVSEKGFGLEELTPSYDGTKLPSEAFMRRVQDITEEAYKTAKKDRALSYFVVDHLIDSIATAVKNNHGAIIGITGSNNGTWLSKYPKMPTAGEELWYHWVYIGKAKMIKGKKYVAVLNSWGEQAGDKGWQWISEDYIKSSYVFAVWTLVYNTNPPSDDFKYTFNNDLEYRQKRDEIKKLQTALQLDGTFPMTVPITDFYGDITRQAVYDFQVKYSVAPFYILWFNKGKYCSKATRAKLNSLFAK